MGWKNQLNLTQKKTKKTQKNHPDFSISIPLPVNLNDLITPFSLSSSLIFLFFLLLLLSGVGSGGGEWIRHRNHPQQRTHKKRNLANLNLDLGDFFFLSLFSSSSFLGSRE